MIYMFCLYHFSVKCIIKTNYLPPYGPLNTNQGKASVERREFRPRGAIPEVVNELPLTDLDFNWSCLPSATPLVKEN